MQHPSFETRHPLQADDQETGIDPLQNYIQNIDGGSVNNRGTVTPSESEGTCISYRKEWEELFLNSNYLARIRQKGLNGQLRSSRYRSVCWKHIINPRKAAGKHDLVVNNPLSQDEGEMKALLNPDFHEHDAYAMFSQIMETAEPWFSNFEREVRRGRDEMITSIPFARPQDTGPSVAIVTKINRIQDQLLKKHDIELYMHLNRLEIAPQIYGIRWVRLLFGREFSLQDLLVVWDALFADSITLDLVDYIFVAMLLYIRDALIASNYQTCLGLLMHYPPIGDLHALLHKALFLRDPKVDKGMGRLDPSTWTRVSCLDYSGVEHRLHAECIKAPSTEYRAHRGTEVPRAERAPSRTCIATQSPCSCSPDVLKICSGISLVNLVLLSSMENVVTGGGAWVSIPVQTVTDIQGQGSRNVSSSPSAESIPVGREHSASPPLSVTKKDSLFNISRSRSHSKTMGKKESEEDLDGQISFLQGQLNDLEAMSKYCAKMMNVHIVHSNKAIEQSVIHYSKQTFQCTALLQQTAQLCRALTCKIKDILKGSLRFNQSLLEAEENEEITIADDHYCSSHHSGGGGGRRGHKHTDKEAFLTLRPQQADSEASLNSEGRNSDDYILVSQQDDVEQEQCEKPDGAVCNLEYPDFPKGHKVALKPEKEALCAAVCSDPLMGAVSGSSSTSGSSPEDDSSNSKDSDFTIVNPTDL
ncbi:UNVERIFIED_CONTAM: hypothetical protein FKN15_072906 [Acipenser sinensis]